MELSFVNVSRNMHSTGPRGDELGRFGLLFEISNKVTILRRSVYTVWDMFGDVGGLYDFAFGVLSYPLTLLSGRLLLTTLVQKLFHKAPYVRNT